jgi:hypothetical protein
LEVAEFYFLGAGFVASGGGDLCGLVGELGDGRLGVGVRGGGGGLVADGLEAGSGVGEGGGGCCGWVGCWVTGIVFIFGG